MHLTPRDITVLIAVAHHYTLIRKQVALLCFSDDKSNGRIPRARLQALVEAGLINRTRMEVCSPAMGIPAPVYFPSRKGCAYLAQQLEDEKYLTVCTQTPNWTYLYHWVEVAGTHIMLDAAVKLSKGVAVTSWIGEWDIANPDEKEPHKRFKLFTLLQEHPRLVCAPDAGFLLEIGGHSKAYYVEQDRDTTQPAARVAAQKAPGFAGLAEAKGHYRHFPKVTQEKFLVLFVTPDEKRRKALAQAFANKPAADLYRFAALTDKENDKLALTAATMLSEPVWQTTTGEMRVLIPGAGK